MCKLCGQPFRGTKGLRWHRKHVHGPEPVREVQQGDVVMVPVDVALLSAAMNATHAEWGWPPEEPGQWLPIFLHRVMLDYGFDIAPDVAEDGGDAA